MLSLEVVYQFDPDLVVNINKRHVSPSRTSHRYYFVLSAHSIVPMTRAPLTLLE
jgi:hypothetical protein